MLVSLTNVLTNFKSLIEGGREGRCADQKSSILVVTAFLCTCGDRFKKKGEKKALKEVGRVMGRDPVETFLSIKVPAHQTV